MAAPRRPLIGINAALESGARPRVHLHPAYADAVLRAGGIPLIVPPVGGPADVARVLEQLDGLLLSGGRDLDTRRLGLGPLHPRAELEPAAKQDFDVELARAALATELPVLGICLGMQTLGVVGGAGLYQHLPDDRPGSQEHAGNVRHGVDVAEDSRLARLVDARELEVVSSHHQALSSVGSGWRVAARDREGLIEAVEHASHPFAFGVQWHPERSEPGGPHDRLFRALVDAASLAAAKRRA
jgi:putative glutamine amidotransferase